MAILAVQMAFLKNFKAVVYGIYRSSGPHIWSSWAIIYVFQTLLGIFENFHILGLFGGFEGEK